MTASISVATLILVGCGCSSQPSATPTGAERKAPPPVDEPVTTSAPPTSTTTTLPSAPSAVPTTVPIPLAPTPGWSTALTALPPGGGFASLSCISDTFCVASGGGTSGDSTSLTSGSGVADSWDGASWSEPSVYFAAPATGPVTAPILPAISCTSGPSCVIADGSGHVSDGDGTHWSVPLPLAPVPPLSPNPADPGPGHPESRSTAVSCPAPTTCGFVDNTGHTHTLVGGTWLGPQSFGEPDGSGAATVSLYQPGRVGISCPSSSSCTAVVGSSVLDWNGSTWTQEPLPWTSTVAAGPSDPTAIACPTANECLIVNGTGLSFRTSGKAWSPEQTIDPHGGLDSVSCASASFCLAADEGGRAVMWNGTAWSAPDQVIPAASDYPGIGTFVSCPSAQFCMIMNSDGDYATYAGAGPL